jgi:hypothetical protein
MVHQVFNDAFEALLAGWHRYMDMAATTDDAAKLAELKDEIAELRTRATRFLLSRSLDGGGPEERELAAYCPFIRTTVYIPSNEIRYSRDDMLTFACECERQVRHRPTTWLRGTEDLAIKPGGPVAAPRALSRQTKKS